MARQLKDWLKSYLEYAQYTEAPFPFHFWTGVGVIAGALRHKVYFDMSYFRWTPNFYIIFVAPSGVATKSTSMGVGISLLREVKGVNFGPDSVTWQGLVQALADVAEGVSDDPGNLMGSNIEQVSELTFASSELGNFLDPDDRQFVDLLVNLWDGKESFQRMTKGEGATNVFNPWINLIACTTPSWIAQSMGKIFITGGFTSRCVFVYAETKRQLVPYPTRIVQRDLLALRSALIHDLTEIAQIKGQYTMTEEAYVRGEQWYEAIHRGRKAELALGGFDGYLSRKQGHAHKIAMALNASRTSDRIITLGDFEQAITLLEALEQDMPKVFRHIGSTPDLEKAEHLIDAVHQYKEISRQALYRILFSKYGIGTEDYIKMLNAAIEAGFVMMKGDGRNVILHFVEQAQDRPASSGSIAETPVAVTASPASPAPDSEPAVEPLAKAQGQ